MDLAIQTVTAATVRYGHENYQNKAAGTQFKIELPQLDVLRYTVPSGKVADIDVRVQITERAA